jgi:hypothetical protein
MRTLKVGKHQVRTGEVFTFSPELGIRGLGGGPATG